MNNLEFAFCFVEYKNSKWADLLIHSIRRIYNNPIYLTTATNYSNSSPNVNIFKGKASWPEFGFLESNHTKGLEFLVNQIKSDGFRYAITLDNDSILLTPNILSILKDMQENNFYLCGQEDYGPIEILHRRSKHKIHPSFCIIGLLWFKTFFPSRTEDYIKDYSETYYGLTEKVSLDRIKFLDFSLVSPDFKFGIASKTLYSNGEVLSMHAWYGANLKIFPKIQL